MLDDRKKKILQAIVEEYIGSAEPVSSKTLVDDYGLNFSSATIRNEMAELEKIGYLDKPHTSSGRVPSAEGYRYYVNELISNNNISLKEIKYIKAQLETKINQIEDLTKITTSTISEITHYTSVGIAPRMENQEIKEIKFVLLGNNVLMAIIYTMQGLIKETIIRFDEEINEKQVELLTSMFNTKLAGKPLTEIAVPFEEYLFDQMESIVQVVKSIVEQLKRVLEEDSLVFMEGTDKSFELPELQKIDTAKNFINLLDLAKNNKMMKSLQEKNEISEINDEDINVYIGDDNDDNEYKDFSIVTLKNEVEGEDLGTIAVIGPKRMDYSKVISAMKYVKEELKAKGKRNTEKIKHKDKGDEIDNGRKSRRDEHRRSKK